MSKNLVLDFRQSAVRRALQHPELKNRQLIGRGTYAAVFNKKKSVVKLTSDPATYALFFDPSLNDNPHFPRLIQNFGPVGKLDTGSYLYLIEVEKLRPVSGSNHIYDTLLDIVYDKHAKFSSMPHQAAAEVFRQHLRGKKCTLPNSIRDAVNLLLSFCKKYDAAVDLSADNIMIRAATNELVFSDPVVDLGYY